jgi:hypothetical protein
MPSGGARLRIAARQLRLLGSLDRRVLRFRWAVERVPVALAVLYCGVVARDID